MSIRAKYDIDPSSPWAKANRPRSRLSGFLGKALPWIFVASVAGLFCWMAIEEPAGSARGKPTRLPSFLVNRPQVDIDRKADEIMKQVQNARSAGKQDRTFRKPRPAP